MSFQYDFPSELLLVIFRNVEAYEDLLTLAATCRRFNHLSLQVFFSKHNFDPNSKRIILLGCHHGSLQVISAMAMSLALWRTSLEYLRFDFGHHTHGIEPLLQRIRILARLIRNFSTIDRVTVHIEIPYHPAATDWKAAYVALLDTVIGKSCSNLYVRATFRSDENLLSISKTPSWFRIPGRLPVAVKNSDRVETKHLKNCLIDAFPTFLRPFYLRVLKANAAALMCLAFHSINGQMTAIDWGFLITNIHLPVLKRFTISFGHIPRDAIIKFLSKHPHLTHFEYHHIRYTTIPKGVPRELKGVFKNLERLTTSPEHILNFLPTMDRMLCLTFIAIIIENGHEDFSVVEQVLRCLSSCVKKVELRLDISLPLETLPALVPNRSSFRGEDSFMLRCVESLHITWRWRYTADDLAQIPAWLKQFPELTKLTLKSYEHMMGRLGMERTTLPTFFEQVKLACPAIASISLPGESELVL